MAERHWKRLRQSEVMGNGGEVPGRIVIEHDAADHSYRTYLETVSADSKSGLKAARYFYWEEEAIEDYNEGLGLTSHWQWKAPG